jgi:hypothetical protein
MAQRDARCQGEAVVTTSAMKQICSLIARAGAAATRLKARPLAALCAHG